MNTNSPVTVCDSTGISVPYPHMVRQHRRHVTEIGRHRRLHSASRDGCRWRSRLRTLGVPGHQDIRHPRVQYPHLVRENVYIFSTI